MATAKQDAGAKKAAPEKTDAKKAAPKAAAKPVAEKKAAPKAAAAKKVAVEFVADCPLATTVSTSRRFPWKSGVRASTAVPGFSSLMARTHAAK